MKAYRRILFLVLLLMSVAVVWQPSSPALAASNDNNVEWGGLLHNSRDPLYRSPSGAVPTGTAIRLRIRANSGDLTAASVRVWNDRTDVSNMYPMTRIAQNVIYGGDLTPYEFWEVTLPASAVSTVYWYRFIVYDGSDTNYYEDDGGRTGGFGQVYDSSPDNSWQLTIYDSGFSTPNWVKNAVIYQIFPDRFRDGDSANNPTAGGFFYGNYDTVVRSNTANWNAPICDPRNNAGSTYTCNGIYSQNFYGGDLQGIIDELPYLDGLGITAIYLNPIFESPSNHKYDTTDFLHIDDNFGTIGNDALSLATFTQLVNDAHALGINIILDGVFNHASSDSVYFDRYSRWTGTSTIGSFPASTAVGVDDNSGACETNAGFYSTWFPFFAFVGTPPAPCSDNRDYPKWFGIFDSLPVFKHDEIPVRDYFINNGANSVGPYWVNLGIDGWRLDVAPEIDHGTLNDPTDDYWEDFRAAVHAIDPNVYIVGEEWGNPTSWTIDNQWDATMNYQFSAAVLSFWRDSVFTDNDFNSGSSAGVLNPLDAGGVNERLLNLEERYAPEAFQAMMNLFGSHDTNRVLFLLDHNAGSNNVALYNNPAYDWSDAISRLRGAALMQMTLPGAPTIYYGDEIGLVGPVSRDGSTWQDDPYNRQPYPWLDETGTPYYNHLQSVPARTALYNYYQSLITIRNNNVALRTGTFDPLYTSGDIYAYGRNSGDSNVVIVVVNGSGSAAPATVNVSGYIPAGGSLTDLLTSTAYSVDASGNIVIGSVPARGGLILRLNTAIARPACINPLTATGVAGAVNLSWGGVANATSYDVYRSRISGGAFDFIGNTSSTTYSDTTVVNATTYYYVVVGKNNTTLLTSDFYCNDEASATPALAINWHTLQWPFTMTHTVSAVLPTVNIYGRVYIAGVSGGQNAVDPTPGLIAEVGYGPQNTHPNTAGWTWFPATFNMNQGNDDEFMGTMIVTAAPGTYWYTYRWSTDGGLSWSYSRRNDYGGGNYSLPELLGVMTLNAATDTTPPAAPTNLTVTGTTTASISLGWDAHPNTDGDLYGFRVYRENTASPGYVLIQTVVGAGATSFVDNTVTSGQNYNYYITAIDNSNNQSTASNVVNATAQLRNVAVTFVVTVPNPSPGTIYIAGSFNGWNPGANPMTQTGPNTWETTLTILDTQSIQYKYTRGDWNRVEKQADGNAEISDRVATANYGTTGTQTVNNTVANWRDPLVVSTVPADTATGIAPGSTIQIVWNQDMPTTPSGVTVTGPSGAVAGVWSFDAPSNTSTFTPSAVLEAGLHTVTATGSVDVNSDVQQVPTTFTFDVGLPAGMVAVTFRATVPSHTPTDVYLVGDFGSFGGSPYPSWNPSGILMTETSPNVWEVTLILPDATNFQYKYTRNDWTNVEMQADGNTDILGGANRPLLVVDNVGHTQLVTDTVANWQDPYVISVTPANLSINNAPNTVVTIGWNQDMPATLGGLFTLTGAGPITGTITYDSLTDSHTFTPSASLPDGTYTVAVSGNSDVASQAQQVNFGSSFDVSAIAGVNVTFSVTVPSHTPGTVYIVGSFGVIGQPDWVTNGIPLTETSPNVWEVTFNAVPVGTSFQYKYTRGAWESVEKEADGNAEILGGANRTLNVTLATGTINDTVANWRDPYIISSSPADGTITTDGNIPAITFTWNQAMPASLPNNAPTGVFTVLDSALNPVAGTLTYDGGTNTHTFAPTTLPLPNETYTITLTGNNDVNGDTQQIPSTFDFTVTNVLYDLVNNSWFNLQWPPTINYVLSVTPTENIYGQIWINGVTGGQNAVNPTPGLLAEVGYGPDGVAPNDPAWVWFPTTFNVNAGNNDEFMGTLLPTAAGTYDYLYRYSGDGGATWYYGTNAGPFRDLTMATYNPADAGNLVVTAPADTTPPAAPTNLVVTSVTDVQVVLGWDAHPNTDGDLYGFEVYRDGVLIATITDPLATSYTDTGLTASTVYAYYIIAVDVNTNASGQSNTVSATTSATPTGGGGGGGGGGGNSNNPPTPMLIIRFMGNNNFVSRGGARDLEIIFQNLTGREFAGSLELIFPNGLRPGNSRSTHGVPTSFQALVQSVMNYAKRIGNAQQNVATQNDLRLNFGTVANGAQVTLNTTVTVDASYTQPSAIIEARLIENGVVVDTVTALLVIDNNISGLPATGETPLWRDLLLIGLLGLAGFGVAVSITRKRANSH